MHMCDTLWSIYRVLEALYQIMYILNFILHVFPSKLGIKASGKTELGFPLLIGVLVLQYLNPKHIAFPLAVYEHHIFLHPSKHLISRPLHFFHI